MKQYYNQRHELACDIDSELPPEPLFEDVRPIARVGHLPPRRKRQLWFLRWPRFRVTPVTRLLSVLTTRKVTAVLMYGKETLPDRNRTRKIDGV